MTAESNHAQKVTTKSAAVGRIASLDGLRGVAAVVVLIHHALLVIPGLAGAYYGDGPQFGTWQWAFTYTPIHLLWEGSAAVYIFFVLSGFVITLPTIRAGSSFRWLSYYPKRLARLYLPVWGAVAFAAITMFIVSRDESMDSAWLDARTQEVTPAGTAMDLTLLAGAGKLVSPLWSLRWEVAFSLLLPVFVWAAIRFRTYIILGMSACLAITTVGGAIGNSAMVYLPMFMLGVLIAVGREKLARWNWNGRGVWCGVMLAFTLLGSHWIAQAFQAPPIVLGALNGATTAGALGIVLFAAFWPAAQRLLERKVVQWLGTVSFSLYLIHEPIVIGVAFAFGAGFEIIAVLLSIPISLVVAYGFYRIIEFPSQRIARRIQI